MTRPLSRPILFDITRLLTRIGRGAPTGIDRVDLAYADHYLTAPGFGGALRQTLLGPRLHGATATRHVLDILRGRWQAGMPSASPAADRVTAWLAGPPAPPPPEPRSRHKPSLMRNVAEFGMGMLASASERAPTRHAPKGAVYLHTSHIRLDKPALFDWLADRPDIRPVFFVHDLIPIEFPEYGIPGEEARHRIRMATISRHAAAIVTSTEAVAASYRHHVAREGLRATPPIVVAPIGVEEAFGAAPAPAPARRPYFVVCGTIEARKNHLLLLQIWREFAKSLEPAAVPALVIVGRRGWESEAAVDMLERCDAIRPHVIEASGLPTEALASLMAGAQALLMPSFCEGYGIPVAEALAAGAPVIASALPAHREITGGEAILLGPLDGKGWEEAILRAAREPAAPRRPSPAPSWSTHFEIVDALLADL